DEAAKSKIQKIIEWQYPFEAATRRAAKSSVTILRRQAEELDEASELVFSNRKSKIKNRKLSAADAGTAAHKFLQYFNFQNTTDLRSLEAEAARLEKENYLSGKERGVLELKNVLAFWNSKNGKQIISKSKAVRRELPFSIKFSPRELDKILGTESAADLQNEF